jgi:thiol-disulfide isomerase/thioredoxin
MKQLLAAVALAALAAGADGPKTAGDKKEPAGKDNPTPSLKAGDRAPALTADRWFQGEAVRRFQPGKVYVVEFWATWCGPCIAFMPGTAELLGRYKDRDVTVIAFTARDPDNPEEKVAAFVKKRGPKLPFTFAYADDRTTYDAWMKAAGRDGIPCSFVVDKSGRGQWHRWFP